MVVIMKVVEWTDERGYRHRSLLRDGDSESLAPYGVKLDPPPVESLDWAGIQRDLHNELVTMGLVTWHDVQVKQSQGSLTSVILGVLKHRLIRLYREADKPSE